MRFIGSAIATMALVASPIRAEVVSSSESGFVSRNTVQVPASAQHVWLTLIAPSGWWSGEHTYSGDAANLSLDPRAAGCFCEKIPVRKSAAGNLVAGSAEHMRVIYADAGKVLRLSGALGPLQSEAVNGTLTITLTPTNGGTEVLWEYIVGGYMRYKAAEIGPLVDKVLREQLNRLAAKLEARR